MSNTSIVHGSLSAIAQQNGKSLAETFMRAACVAIVDTSGSMEAHDSRGGKSRYEVACEELAQLQNAMPGKIAVVSFSDNAQFCPSGVPKFLRGGTNMAIALQFAKLADVAKMRFVLISDGQPDNPEAALSIATAYKNKIDTVFVGPEGDSAARAFLEKIAKLSGGQHLLAANAKELQKNVTHLLAAG